MAPRPATSSKCRLSRTAACSALPRPEGSTSPARASPRSLLRVLEELLHCAGHPCRRWSAPLRLPGWSPQSGFGRPPGEPLLGLANLLYAFLVLHGSPVTLGCHGPLRRRLPANLAYPSGLRLWPGKAPRPQLSSQSSVAVSRCARRLGLPATGARQPSSTRACWTPR